MIRENFKKKKKKALQVNLNVFLAHGHVLEREIS